MSDRSCDEEQIRRVATLLANELTDLPTTRAVSRVFPHALQHDPGRECAAVFRPPALSIPVQGPHLRYLWDGRHQAITHVLEVSEHR